MSSSSEINNNKSGRNSDEDRRNIPECSAINFKHAAKTFPILAKQIQLPATQFRLLQQVSESLQREFEFLQQ